MELIQKLKNINVEQNISLDNHLKEIIKQMIINDEENPYENFEKYSELIRRKKLNENSSQNLIFDKNDEMKEQCLLLRKFLNIAPKEEKKIEGDEEQEQEQEEEQEIEPLNMHQVQNLNFNNQLMKKCGISFGKDEIYYLQLSIKEFIRKKEPQKVDFWGKIFGTQNNYYILRLRQEPVENEDIIEDHEQDGTGINIDTYFVSTDILNIEGWIQLPLITSNQMRQARNLKYIFTGDLERKIVSSPPFEGQEKHFLKAQISRIDHSTCLIPSGEYKLKLEEGEEINPSVFTELEKEEEPKLQNQEFYKNIKNWLHFYPNILKQGRTIHQDLLYPPDAEIEDDEKEKIKNYAISLDPFEERLKSIEKDNIEQKVWVQNFHGKSYESSHSITGKKISNQVMSLENLIWPGLYLFWNNYYYFQVYIGYGQKFIKNEYFPKFDYQIQEEEQDIDLQEEYQKPEPIQEEEQNDKQEEQIF